MSIIRIKDEIVREVVSLSLGSGTQIVDHQTEPFSKLQAGMIASHYILTIRIRKQEATSGVLSHTFFVKSSRDLGSKTKAPISDEDSFQEEVRFFTEILPQLGSSDFSPKCWFANRDLLIFEDLRTSGLSMQSGSTFLDPDSSKLALSALAKLHASSYRLEKPLNSVYQFRERHFCPESKLSRSVGVSLRTALQLSRHFGFPTIHLRVDRLAKMVRPDPEFNVLCHGDVWRNNLMFNSVKCILVDYQLLRYTSPGSDLAMFTYLNCSPELRGTAELEDLIRHYCEVFSEVSGSKAPSFKDVLRAYDERKLLGAFYAVMFLPRVLMPEKEHWRLLENQEELEGYLFGDRFKVILRIMNTYPKYEDVIRKLVKEYSELVAED